ncbi:MAG: helix-turn-helix transcriptional regulator [Acidobacteria bacterium]|nr:helix-turn-helix transcriptional regulator [Acidobacteriota bacterium]
MIELRVREIAEERGISNPFALSKESGVAYANCYKIWNNQQKMISLDTIDRLCEALHCEPGDILVKAPTTTTRKAGATKSRPRDFGGEAARISGGRLSVRGLP